MDVFVHIPKSSGTTIRAILSREYGVQNIVYYEPASSRWRDGVSSSDEFLKQEISDRSVSLITGHHRFGIHSLLKRHCRYFSMMRDPIDRALSDYYYAFSYVHHRFREEISSGKLSVEEFLTNGLYFGGNEQAEMLAGILCSPKDVVRTAIQQIWNSFMVVGISERFDESVLLMAKALGWKPPIFVMKNVTRLDSEMEKERADAGVQAHSYYAEPFESDYEVYRAADRHLSKLIHAEGTSFQHALESFREIQSDIATRAEGLVYEKYELREDDQLPEFAARFVGSNSYRTIEDYLREADSMPRSANNYVGAVDRIGPDRITGWAGDLSSNRPVHVTVWHLGERIATVACNIVRDDLSRAGFSPTPFGFEAKLKVPMTTPDDYAVCFDDSSIRLPDA